MNETGRYAGFFRGSHEFMRIRAIEIIISIQVYGNRENRFRREICISDKNGYGTMVVMSLNAYAKLQDRLESAALKDADRYAEQTDQRMTHEEVYQRIRNSLKEEIR